MRPGELYGMGKESLTISGEDELFNVIELICRSSKIKHTNCLQGILGTTEFVEMEEWKRYIGQPAFFIVDIEITPIE